jgi:hypothetical protein
VLLLSTLMDFNTDSNEMEVFESSAWCQTNVPVSSSHGAQLRVCPDTKFRPGY